MAGGAFTAVMLASGVAVAYRQDSRGAGDREVAESAGDMLEAHIDEVDVTPVPEPSTSPSESLSPSPSASAAPSPSPSPTTAPSTSRAPVPAPSPPHRPTGRSLAPAVASGATR